MRKAPHTNRISSTMRDARNNWTVAKSNFCYTCGVSFELVPQFSLDCVDCWNEIRLRSALSQSAKSRGAKDYFNVVAYRPAQPLG